ncbi:hypothetical protein SH449x_001194 [Pirellulaceae bacterium SH449]
MKQNDHATNTSGLVVDFLQRIANCWWRNGIIVTLRGIFRLSVVFTKTYDENLYRMALQEYNSL